MENEVAQLTHKEFVIALLKQFVLEFVVKFARESYYSKNNKNSLNQNLQIFIGNLSNVDTQKTFWGVNVDYTTWKIIETRLSVEKRLLKAVKDPFWLELYPEEQMELIVRITFKGLVMFLRSVHFQKMGQKPPSEKFVSFKMRNGREFKY